MIRGRFRGVVGAAIVGVAACCAAGCQNTEPTPIQFPPGTKPQEPVKIDPSKKASTGGGVMSTGDPSEYTRVPGSP